MFVKHNFFSYIFLIELQLTHYFISDRWNLEERTFEEMWQTVLNVFDIISMNPNCQINGVVSIWNLEGFNMRYMSQILWKNRIGSIVSFAQVRTNRYLFSCKLCS